MIKSVDAAITEFKTALEYPAYTRDEITESELSEETKEEYLIDLDHFLEEGHKMCEELESEIYK